MKVDPFQVVVPATTANIGPGFDSVGIALTECMTVTVQPSKQWKVHYVEAEFKELATDESNLIIQTIHRVAERYQQQVSPVSLHITSTIPLGKGFGSSASAIATGIVIADTLLQLSLSDDEKVLLGCLYEGHADNVSAALLGGVVINYFDGKTNEYIHIPTIDVTFVTLIPPEVLRTTESRDLLPDTIMHLEAVKSSTANGLLTAALMLNDWTLIGKMMEKDLLHERYRKQLLPHFDDIRALCRQLGAFGMTISGAGPSLIIAVQAAQAAYMKDTLEKTFPYYRASIMKASKQGATIYQLNAPY